MTSDGVVPSCRFLTGDLDSIICSLRNHALYEYVVINEGENFYTPHSGRFARLPLLLSSDHSPLDPSWSSGFTLDKKIRSFGLDENVRSSGLFASLQTLSF